MNRTYLFDFKYSEHTKNSLYLQKTMKKIWENIDSIQTIYFMDKKGSQRFNKLFEISEVLSREEKFAQIQEIIRLWIISLS